MRFFTTCSLAALLLASCKDSIPKGEGIKNSVPEVGLGLASDFPVGSQIFGETVFPEEVLKQWGYQTVEVDGGQHSIRSEKNYGSSDSKFYARFWLAKAKFTSAEEAFEVKQKMEALLKSDVGFKDYTELLQQDDFLFSIRATSNYTYLEHQPKILDLAAAYLGNH